jgi:hypothetical protein
MSCELLDNKKTEAHISLYHSPGINVDNNDNRRMPSYSKSSQDIWLGKIIKTCKNLKKTFPSFQGKVLGYACLGVLPKEYGSSCHGYR